MKTHAEIIFKAGLERVNASRLLQQVIKLEGKSLTVETDSVMVPINFADYKKIKVIGFGKAAAHMALGLHELLGQRISEGIIIVKEPSATKLPSQFEVLVGSHPIPSEKSEKAGRRLLEFTSLCATGELVLGLISGGASALAEVPSMGLQLKDLEVVTGHLLKSGATIQEINQIRKHLSAIKGGQLSKSIHPATNVNFILSDVVGDDLSVIGSGPTVPDESTFKEAWTVIQKYKLEPKMPSRVLEHFENWKAGSISETPKPGNPCFEHTRNIMVGTNRQALLAARKKAEELGYDVQILNPKLTGEAREAAVLFYDRWVALQAEFAKTPGKKPVCVLAGGETTVTVGGPGKGGRNQEMALAFLCRLADTGAAQSATSAGGSVPVEAVAGATPGAASAASAAGAGESIFLSATTDGADGPTDAAGAFASVSILAAAAALKLNPKDYLAQNDSNTFYEKIGGVFKTGPTDTNVCDLQIMLVRG